MQILLAAETERDRSPVEAASNTDQHAVFLAILTLQRAATGDRSRSVCLKPIWLRPRQAPPCCVSPLSQFAPAKSLPCFFIFVIFVRFYNSFPLPNPPSQNHFAVEAVFPVV